MYVSYDPEAKGCYLSFDEITLNLINQGFNINTGNIKRRAPFRSKARQRVVCYTLFELGTNEQRK